MSDLQTAWPLWPGCAILIAVLTLTPMVIWPVLILVSLAGFILFDLQAAAPISSIAWFIPADALQVLTAAIALRYCFKGIPRFNNAYSLARYGFFVVFLAPFLAAFLSARGIPGDYWTSWRISFLSEVLASIALTPAILVWSTEGTAWLQKPRTRHIEFAALIAITVLLGYLTFAADTKNESPALLYSLVPFLLWSTLRFGWIGITSSLIIISFLSIWGEIHGRGPFYVLGTQNSMLALQLCLIFAAIPFMILAAVEEDRRVAGERLADLSRRLIEAQEEERKRIARDIHDDYSQRIALLASDVEQLTENVANLSPEEKERLVELFQGICELGADLHSLSHQLHSSTLESLGLVAGVRAFCEEFAETEHLGVDFAHGTVPRGIPGDAALCLFRIVQEGLRNVKKHSGASNASVRIECLDENIHLMISDDGKGCDLTHPAGSGIGIWSMQERLQILGGRLQIQSQPMQGTRIDAWLPSKTEE